AEGGKLGRVAGQAIGRWWTWGTIAYAREKSQMAGACRNRTYRAPFRAQTVLKTAQATRPNPLPCRPCLPYCFTATASISTRAPFGRLAACTVERAGLWVPKCFA